MPGLAGALSGVENLNGRGLVDGLVGDLGGQLTDIGQVDVVVSADGTADVSGQIDGLDFSEITASLGDLPGQVASLSSQLPAAEQVMRPITGVLELVEQVTASDLPAQIENLANSISSELGGGAGGFIDRLLRAASALSTAPEGQALLSLLEAVLEFGGARLPDDTLRFPNALPALDNTVKLLGGTMALTSVITESERLCGVMAEQLDATLLQSHAQGLLACFGSEKEPLADFVASLDPADALAVDAAASALTECRARLDELTEALRTGMGFGEATLVYLDVDQVQTELEAAAAQLRGADPQPLERVMQSISDLIQPFLSPDLSDLPEYSLDGLLLAVEARVEEFAEQIRTVDVAPLAQPVDMGVGGLTEVLERISGIIEQITSTVAGALDQVRQGLEALPIDTVVGAIERALEPINSVLDALADLVGGIQDAIETAVDTMMSALREVERLIDEFKAALQAAFGEAGEVFETFNIDLVIGEIEDKIQALVDLLTQVQLAPYFDAASSAIDSAADVIDAVPFGLLPDSMKQEVDAAVLPVKQVDADAFAIEIRGVLQLEDGKFGLRDEVVGGLVGLQQQYDELLAAVRQYDPHTFVAELDERLVELSDKIGQLTPDLSLAPLQEALDHFKEIVATLDLGELLQPVDAEFDKVLAALDEFDPATLVVPIEQRIDEARNELTSTIKLDEWRPKLDEAINEMVALVEVVDPQRLEPGLRAAIEEGRQLLDTLPDTSLFAGAGAILAQLLSGSGQRIYPWSFELIVEWLSGTGGTDALQQRATAIGESLDRTLAAVEANDITELSVQIAPKLEAVRTAVEGLPPGSLARTTLEPMVNGLNISSELSVVAGHRTHYLAALSNSQQLSETLRRIGLSEIDATLTRLAQSFSPLRDARDLLAQITRRLGLPGLEDGLAVALKNLLDVATADRLVGIVMPIFTALRERIETLIDGIADPLREAIAEIERSIGLIDISPLRERLDATFMAARDPIAALRPSTLLADQLSAIDALQADVADFDPLGAILDGLQALEETAQRVLDKLKANELLEDPLSIYDHIMSELERVNLDGLLTPILDQLDDLANQVDLGLDETVDSFQALQDALPSGPGSTGSVSGNISLG